MRVVGHGDADPTAADTVLVLDDDPRFAPDVASTLDLAAGATVRRGAETTLSLRGAGGHQLRLFLDGIPLDDGRGAALDLDRLPASALASIRIRRGAAAATFGSGAQGGVVQLHTHRRPVQRLRLRLGAFGERAADAVVADRLGAADLLVALGTQTSAGDFPYVDTNGQPRTRQNNRRARLDGLARARVPLGAAGGLTALAAGQIGARGEPGLEQFEQPDAHSDHDQGLVGLAWTADRPAGLPADVSVQAYALRRRFDFADPAPAFAGAARAFRLDDAARGARLTVDPASTPTLQPSLAAELRHERARTVTAGGERPGERDEARLAIAAAGSLAWQPVSALTAQATLRVDDTDARDALLVPAAGLAWSPWPALTLRANAGRLFRDPGFDELYFEATGLRGNPDLRPEDGLGADIGATFSFQDGSLSLTAFTQRYDRLILFVPVNAWLIEARDDFQARADGLELEVSARWGILRGRGAALLQRTTLDDGPPLPFRPEAAATAQVALALGPTDVFATHHAQASVTSDRFGHRTLPARHLLDVGVAAALGPWRVVAEVTNSLDDRRVLDAIQQPRPGRAWHLGLAFSP
ncbi:MAG: TonB-dependent receptor [Myxococcales bacterium]|nr:TonB-dependent receptor [Myxococcales bacterium]